MFKKPMKF